METVGSSPSSQPLVSDPYTKLTKPFGALSFLTVSVHLRLDLSSVPFPSGFPTKILNVFLTSTTRATFPTYIILINILKNLKINLTLMFCEWIA